ncbi:MAG: GNAT family N-acetyltransferase [Clostridia bacterium]|nr:GNAT family N-acetyltransferase [Clostridia bacterium]
MDISIRKCLAEDVNKVGALYDKVTLYLEQNVNYPKWSYKEYPSLEYARSMNDSGAQYLAEKDGVVVAAFVLNEDPAGNYAKVRWGKSIAEGEYLVIHALAVDQDHYGEKIGTRVVEFCLKTAREKGYKAVRLDVIPENIPAKKLYLSCGFKEYGDYDLDRPYDFKYFSMMEFVF